MRGKKKPKCGETERDTGRSMEALVARLPRMLSDSGRLMTGSRGRSESERAGATLRTGAPLSLGQSTQAAQPAPPAAKGGAASHPIHLSIHPSMHGAGLFSPQPSQCLISLINTKVNRRWKAPESWLHTAGSKVKQAPRAGLVHAALRDATIGAGSCFECVHVCDRTCMCKHEESRAAQHWHSGGSVFQTTRQSEVQSEVLSVVLIRAR